jgi:pilus assembly protein CpaE
MNGSRDRFGDDGDLDQLAEDLDLDMDAPIGATFAAALRQPETDPMQHRAAGYTAEGSQGFSLDSEDDLSALDFESDDFAPLTSAMIESSTPPRETPPAWAEDPPMPAPAPIPGFEPAAAPPRARMEDVAPPPVADDEPADAAEESAGQGLGYDYAFGAQPTSGDRAIPRITIHAFCTKTPMLGVMRTIQKDRRMKNVHMEVHEGGAQMSIDHYVNETTPNLLIIESSVEPRQLLAELDALAEHCDENIRVLVIGYTNDIRLYRELIRRGVSEYLVAPIDPVQMIRSIAGLFADPEAPFTGKTLAVTGVKGGVGASSIAHNLAWALSERVKVNATLVDLDLNFGTTGLDFNQDAQATIADALMSPDRFDDAVMGRLITKATDRLSLFTAPATLDRTYNLDPETYVKVLEQVRSSVPFVVLDLPHIWSDWFKSTVISADELVVVAGPDLASLRNGKNLIDFLKAARPNDAPPRLVLNMVGLPKRPEIPAKDFGQAIGLEPSLVLPFDAQLFGTAANNGQMVFDVAPESKVAQGLDALATQLSGKEIQAEKPSLIKKLLRR